MIGYRSLRAAAIALELYGVLGLFIAAAMVVVGASTFNRVATIGATLESERVALVQSLRTATSMLGNTATSTVDFQKSVDTARQAADQGSKLANDSAGNFRDLGASLRGLSVFGVQPLATLSPQFDQSADQLQGLAITLGTSRDALAQSGGDIGRVSGDLLQLQTQLSNVATSLDKPGVLGLDAQTLLPFQVAFYGMCLLVVLQSAFAIVVGVVLYRLQRVMGTSNLFTAPETATTTTATASEPATVVPYRARR